ncbi:MAG: hypothetical protein A3B37_00185 [Candidatus Sungbacteria bacterium RIFCSPLOWO2_01_FULL_59_16]|uniref:Uncharacterized protein n=1 Tax=Candidatus Sungbacteria bacterium RIFCSPLOWO2_01_FULL_59_16 TaxID=1802280 RepID=A0A1G2LA59_9BACT|nr:MAG: hypothetical protein A3B37_00185 [Candidatus Sungbacteria bacterium RIFCSPLOWO2_01_FULL_59_16]
MGNLPVGKAAIPAAVSPLGAGYLFFHAGNFWIGAAFAALMIASLCILIATLTRYIINFRRRGESPPRMDAAPRSPEGR